jgi:hypothetical protein
LLFSIIYSFRMPREDHHNRYKPAFRRTRWDLTEQDLECDEPEDGIWYKQRKYGGLLNRWQFHQFLLQLSLQAECSTMGSIGAPGFGFGMVPATSFCEEYGGDPYLNAYVTPFTREMIGVGDDDEMFNKLDIPDSDGEYAGLVDWEDVEKVTFDLYHGEDQMRKTCHEWHHKLKALVEEKATGQRRLFN